MKTDVPGADRGQSTFLLVVASQNKLDVTSGDGDNSDTADTTSIVVFKTPVGVVVVVVVVVDVVAVVVGMDGVCRSGCVVISTSSCGMSSEVVDVGGIYSGLQRYCTSRYFGVNGHGSPNSRFVAITSHSPSTDSHMSVTVLSDLVDMHCMSQLSVFRSSLQTAGVKRP
jgi:hypothetical protein